MSTALARWNPLTPLAWAVFLVALAYCGPQPWAAVVALVAALTSAIAGGVGRRVAQLSAAVGVPTWIFLFIMNAVVAPPADPDGSADRWRTAAIVSWEAWGVAVRLAAAVAALAFVAVGVAPRRLTRALAERGLPAWAAYIIVASLEAVPQARRRAAEVLDAQRCRGLSVRGGMLGRARALVPLAGPLVASLVTESEERALALDARAFRPSGRRTAMTRIADRHPERLARGVLWLAAGALIVWRLAP